MDQELEDFYAKLLRSQRKGTGLFFLDILDSSLALDDVLNPLVRPGERLSPLAQRLGVSADELTAALYAFLREYLFSPGNDHYQVLGLPADASEEQIRQRYRLLIGLLHPDRITHSEQWVEQAVRKLNTAYADLKRKDRRRKYDAGLRHRKAPAPSRNPVRSVRPAKASRPAPSVSIRPAEALYRIALLQRHPRMVIWSLIVLGLMLVVLAAMESNTTTTLTLAQTRAPAAMPGDKVPQNPLIWNVSPVSPVTAEAQASHDEKKTVGGGMEAPLAADARQGASGALPPEPDPKPVKRKPASVSEFRPEKPGGTRTVIAPARHEAAGAQGEKVQAVATTEPDKAPVMGFDGAAPPSDDAPLPETTFSGDSGERRGIQLGVMQPETVIMRYVSAYENGDLQGLLGLFTLDGRTNSSRGRAQIGKDYERLFRATKTRKIQLRQVKIISGTDSGYKVLAQVRATTVTVVDGKQIGYAGMMVFDLIPKGKRLYITRLLHNIQAVE